MVGIFFGVFLILHGLVHLLYLGQSRRAFELQPGLDWPDGSWAFSRILGDETTRLVAGLCLALVALGFIAGGAGIVAGQRWWRLLVASTALFSAVLYMLLWDGQWRDANDKGAVGLLINAVILTAVLIFRWPPFGI